MVKAVVAVALVFALMLTPASAQTPEAEEHVQPSIATNARHLLPTTTEDTVAVILHGDPDEAGIMPFIVMNGTGETVSVREVKIDAYNADDDLIGVAKAGGGAFVNPDVLAPGDIAAGYVYLMDIDLGSISRMEFSVEAREPDRMNSAWPSMHFEGVNWTGSALVGKVINPGDTDASTVTFSVVCLSDDGELMGHGSDFQSVSLEPGEGTTFQVSLYSDTDCEHFVLGANAI